MFIHNLNKLIIEKWYGKKLILHISIKLKIVIISPCFTKQEAKPFKARSCTFMYLHFKEKYRLVNVIQDARSLKYYLKDPDKIFIGIPRGQDTKINVRCCDNATCRSNGGSYRISGTWQYHFSAIWSTSSTFLLFNKMTIILPFIPD